MSTLPIIDVEKYFNDPSIPDGVNVGFVSPQGIVHDRFGKAIGIDSKHENAQDNGVLERLRDLVAKTGQGSVLPPLSSIPHQQRQESKPSERKMVKWWLHKEKAISMDNFGDLWVLEGAGYNLCWVKVDRYPVLPPLPQGA